MITEAEIGVMWPESGNTEPPEARRGKAQVPLKDLGASRALLDIRFLGSRTVKKYISVIESHSVRGHLLLQPLETNTG